MSSSSPRTKSYLFCLALVGLGNALSIPAALAQDFSPTAIARSSGNLIEKKVYHQSRIRGMKQNLNNYGTQVYDLRVRFDRIFKNRATNLPPPVGFDIGPAYTLPSPDSRPRMVDQGSNGRVDPNEEASPLAFVVERPGELQQPRQVIQPDAGKQSAQAPGAEPNTSVSQRKFDYYFLPRLGMSFPADNEYNSGFAFAASGGVVRDDWRFGVNFNYASNDSSFLSKVIGFTHPGHSETSTYGLLLEASRDIPLPSGWIGSVALGLGGGWSVSDNTVLVNWTERDGGFAWQLGLGARRPVGEASTLFLGYRYLGHPTVRSHNIEVGADLGF